MTALPGYRYWTVESLQRFLLENDLAIAEGLGGDDDMGLTGRGRELFGILAVIVRLDPGPKP